MENNIYRIPMSDKKTLEFFVCNTNTVEPYKKTKELGIVLFGDNLQIYGQLDKDEIDSLIKYLTDCKKYIEDFENEDKK